ncbi:MAG: glutaminase A [Leptolyngbya sp. SIOISBB]|nr:glutaminase A [Leptolyngbya sp. SIOISBB]
MQLLKGMGNVGPPIQSFLESLYEAYRSLNAGQVASYIPELAKADASQFAISVVTLDGRVFQVGDCQQEFTIQSISKVFAYGMALEEWGRDRVLEKVGVEPTGDPFNSHIRLDETSHRPDNPMVNAGAIATTSLVKGSSPTERLNRLLAMFRRYVGRDVYVDISTFLSERATGHRNRAIAHLMLNFGMLNGDIEEALDLYFQQCALLVTCQDLATMAAALANRGQHPITGERVLRAEYVRDVLSVMYTCGMYNFAGEWAFRVGIPAKSGVSGGLIAVIPNQAGIAVFSPPLDENGNSVRGVKVFEALSQKYGFHMFDLSMGHCHFHDSLLSDSAEKLDQEQLL